MSCVRWTGPSFSQRTSVWSTFFFAEHKFARERERERENENLATSARRKKHLCPLSFSKTSALMCFHHKHVWCSGLVFIIYIHICKLPQTIDLICSFKIQRQELYSTNYQINISANTIPNIHKLTNRCMTSLNHMFMVSSAPIGAVRLIVWPLVSPLVGATATDVVPSRHWRRDVSKMTSWRRQNDVATSAKWRRDVTGLF